MNRQKILIVDDSELNREMLKAILGEEYDYAEAENGAQAILMLQQDMNIDLLLLDINMPKIDGFGVLERLNQFRWIEELPVIMISATEDRAVIEHCYSLGITDYIRRPFDSFIVQRRVKNTLTLYANQKRLMGMVSDQIYQNEKDSHVMIGILSHIVEFRNSESAQHVLQVQTVTEMLLRKLTEKTDVYGLTEDKIRLITTASALHEGYRYVLGSVLNQVLLHQSIIGLESKQAMEMLDEYPDIVIGCAGGGSNLGGLISPFMQDKLLGKADPHIIAVEPASCPSFTRGKYVYDFCDTGHVTPLARMYTLGNGFMPAPNHAGGLRYHGMSPILSKLYHDGYMEAVSVKQTDVFDAAVQFAKVETILPAPESSHAIRAAIDEALKCKETGEAKTILFGLTGTGYFDMAAYEAYHNGTMRNHVPTDEELQVGFDTIPPQE